MADPPYENLSDDDLRQRRDRIWDNIHSREGPKEIVKGVFYMVSLLLVGGGVVRVLQDGIDLWGFAVLAVGGIGVRLWARDDQSRKHIRWELQAMDAELSRRQALGARARIESYFK